MISVRELRVGNLVFDNLGGVLQIKGVSIESDLRHIKPIPLTEYWLLKFGAIRQISYQEKVYDCNGLQIYDSEIDGWHLGNEETSLEIESVHQLQNLYFAITGEELEIK